MKKKALECFEENISNLSKNDKEYIHCKIDEYNRLCFELYQKKVTSLPRILDLILEDFYSRIEIKLNDKYQKSFLRNILTAKRRMYSNAYQKNKMDEKMYKNNLT